MNYDSHDLKIKQQMKVNDKYAIRYHRLSTGWEWQYWVNGQWFNMFNDISNEQARNIASHLYCCKQSEVKIIQRKLNNP